MKELEKQIREQRMLLDSEHPGEGHEDRFLQKLQQQPVRRFTIRHVLQVAASVAILVASGLVILNLDRNRDKQAREEPPAAVMEAEVYFASQVDSKVERIREFSFEDSEEKSVLLKELNDLDSYHQQLMNDLEANPSDERVINALIRHYQIKLEIMDQIITQLNQIKSETTEKYENETI